MTEPSAPPPTNKIASELITLLENGEIVRRAEQKALRDLTESMQLAEAAQRTATERKLVRQLPRRPWILSKQYRMTFVLSQDNEIVLGDVPCTLLGEDVLKFILAAVNNYQPQ